MKPVFIHLIAALIVAAPLAPAAEPAPALTVTQPTDRAIFQRDEKGAAEVPIAVTIADGLAESVEVRAVRRNDKNPATEWAKVIPEMKLKLPAGWYQLEFRAMKAGAEVAATHVEHVGIGEVFITCGQSNSANYGQPPQKPTDDRISSMNFQSGRWAPSNDPQPGASGGGGSPWPLLGDILARKYDVPVGFVCLGIGSTEVSAWIPGAGGFGRLEKALQQVGPKGCRAVLWHQGESDSIAGTSADDYAKRLGAAITRSREIAGWELPWGVALASFHPSPQATVERQAVVVAGQRKIITTTPAVFQGPETDSYHTRGFLSDTVHFNEKGLAAHAQGWADALAPMLEATVPEVKAP